MNINGSCWKMSSQKPLLAYEPVIVQSFIAYTFCSYVRINRLADSIKIMISSIKRSHWLILVHIFFSDLIFQPLTSFLKSSITFQPFFWNFYLSPTQSFIPNSLQKNKDISTYKTLHNFFHWKQYLIKLGFPESKCLLEIAGFELDISPTKIGSSSSSTKTLE